MFTLETFTSFLGWCAVINIAVLLFSTLAVVSCKGCVAKIHSKMLGVEEEKLPVLYFQYLGNYKVMTLVFNIAPYLALRLFM